MEFGSAVAYEAGTTYWSDIASLDNDTFVIAFCDAGDGGKGKAIIGTRSTLGVSFGSAYTFETGYAQYVSVCALDSTHFVISYADLTDSSKGKVIAGSVSDSTISFGSIVVAANYDTSSFQNDICAMDSTHFVLAYTGGGASWAGRVAAGSVSGITITLGNYVQFESRSQQATDISICRMDSTHFIIAYKQTLDTKDGMVVCGTFSGTTITLDEADAVAFESAAEPSACAIASLDGSYFIVAFMDGNDSEGKVLAGSLSGTTITISADSAASFETGPVVGEHHYLDIAILSSGLFTISFCDADDSYKGKVIEGSISGTSITITKDSGVVFEAGDIEVGTIQTPARIAAFGYYFIVSYTDDDDSDKGKAIAGTPINVENAVCAIAASASLTSIGFRYAYAEANIQSICSLSISPVAIFQAACVLGAVAACSTEVNRIISSTVSIKSGSSLSLVAEKWRVAAAAINAVSSLSVDGDLISTGEAAITSAAAMTALAALIAFAKADIDAASLLVADFGVPQYIVATLQAVASLAAIGNYIATGTVLITAAGTLTYAGLAFATKRLIYSGTLESGDVLVIDTDEMTVKLNGVNVTMYFTGDFFELFVGDNEIEYFDHEGSRTALVSIDHSDKWI